MSSWSTSEQFRDFWLCGTDDLSPLSAVASVIATASGDGLVHEVINGLAVRQDARKALKTPIAPIPTGSANGMCINLMGVEETFNVPLACLNVIKGVPLRRDCAICI